MITSLFQNTLGKELQPPFERLDYAEAIQRFGLDKPDTRFGLELKDLSDIVAQSDFKVFANVVKNSGIVKAINAKGCSTFSRKEIDDLTEYVSVYRAKGMAWIKVKEDAGPAQNRQRIPGAPAQPSRAETRAHRSERIPVCLDHALSDDGI